MSPLNVGGDGSITWKLEVKKGKPGKIRSSHPAGHVPNGQGPFKNEGEADTTPGGLFEITIQVPKGGGANFKTQLETALTNWKPSTSELKLFIPIEDTANGGPNPNQIKVEWPDSDESGVVRGGGVGPTTA
jgi:hypothetical protein